MKNTAVALLVSLSVGCATLETRADYGYVSQFGVAKEANDYVKGRADSGRLRPDVPFDGHYLFAGVSAGHASSSMTVTATGGLSVLLPTRGPESDLVGAEVRVRGELVGLVVHPYAESFAGVGWTTGRRWEGEGTKHLYSVGGILGVSVPLDGWFVDLGYRFHHLSNGSALFGTREPNVGYNGDAVILGIRRGF